MCKYDIFVAKICKYGIFVAKIDKYGIFVAKIYEYALINRFQGSAGSLDSAANCAALVVCSWVCSCRLLAACMTVCRTPRVLDSKTA